MTNLRLKREQRYLRYLILIIASLATNLAFCQSTDQPPTPLAASLFTTALNFECIVLQLNNPGTNCGQDVLIRNATIPAWGLTDTSIPFQSVTRYNPTPLLQVQSLYGNDGVFFVLAHEGGHHFDLQFPGASVPWVLVPFPPTAGITAAGVASINRELRADAWAGCAIKRSGASIINATALTFVTAGVHNNPYVPPIANVLSSINAGYNAC